MLRRVVIVGAGQAAVQAIDALRRHGYDGSLTLVGEEPREPYQRPPLSKGYLGGSVGPERLALRPSRFYTDHRVELTLGVRAEAIDRQRRILRLAVGAGVPYDALLMATGSRPRRLAVPGAELEGIHVLRTQADADRLRESLEPGKRLVVVGGGYLGLEVAATCRTVGLEVTVLEMAERVFSRVAAPAVSAFYESEHRRHGVHVVCNARVRAFAADGGSRRVQSVVTDRETYPADLVLVAVGVAPADELAADAGLECASGIVVDEHGRTRDPRIHAAGDCASRFDPRYGRRVRLESVDGAFEQGAGAALDLLGAQGGNEKVPWFWSDQFDLKLVIVGLPQGHETRVLRGEPSSRSFAVCYLEGPELVAIETVNRAKDQIAARKLIAARSRFDPARLADAALPLGECVLAGGAQSAK